MRLCLHNKTFNKIFDALEVNQWFSSNFKRLHDNEYSLHWQVYISDCLFLFILLCTDMYNVQCIFFVYGYDVFRQYIHSASCKMFSFCKQSLSIFKSFPFVLFIELLNFQILLIVDTTIHDNTCTMAIPSLQSFDPGCCSCLSCDPFFFIFFCFRLYILYICIPVNPVCLIYFCLVHVI